MKERWKRAAAHLSLLYEQYIELDWAGRYMRRVIKGYQGRIARGERTDKLYKDIMELS